MLTFERMISVGHLGSCFERVRGRSSVPGLDGVTPQAFALDLERRLAQLSSSLRIGGWRPNRLLRVRKDKTNGGTRWLAIPAVEDRVVVEALRRALEPSVEACLSPAAYAYRPGRSAATAVGVVCEQIDGGASYVMLADIQSFFDSIHHSDLYDELSRLSVDVETVALVRLILATYATGSQRGIAQGVALSPALSNLALRSLDERLLGAGHRLVRYSDDLCVASASQSEATEALAMVREEVARLGLTLKSSSRVVDVRETFVWLGFRLGPDGRSASESAFDALRVRLDEVTTNSGEGSVEAQIRSIIRGWTNYFDVGLPAEVTLGRHDAVARKIFHEIRRENQNVSCTRGEVEDDDWLPSDAWSQAGLDEADRLASAGHYAQAQQAYDSVHEATDTVQETPRPCDPEIDEESIDAFLGLFCAAQSRFEVAPIVGESGPRDFRPVERPPGPSDIRAHLRGEVALSVAPRLHDGTCTLAVLDIDGKQEDAWGSVNAYTKTLSERARAWCLNTLVERTGGRGTHLWIPLDRRVSADVVAMGLRALLEQAGRPPDGVHVEYFPADAGAVDRDAQSITLPLSRHVGTGEFSQLRWDSGEAIGPLLQGIFAKEPSHPNLLMGAGRSFQAPKVAKGRSATSATSVTVEKMFSGCALLSHLREKAAECGYLDHAERLSLLYTLGHVGQQGHQAIHAIIAHCHNYDSEETSRQIGRLGPLPIGCRRMREKHAKGDLEAKCNCGFGGVRTRGGYPTPLLHVMRFRHRWREALRERQRPPTGLATEIAEPMVAESMVEAHWSGLGDTEGDDGEGVIVAGVPTHEWA